MHTSDIVIWILTCIFLTIILVRHFIQSHNNSCKTVSDYYSNVDANSQCYYNPDLDSTVPQIIERYGYDVETYEVATEDHHILKVYRIIPRERRGTAKYQPVYVQHGLFQNSIAFLLMGNQSLPFMLASAGYDVWLGNFRGTQYATHTHLSKRESKFWDYSLDEYISNDVLSLLDLVYEQTQQKIVYIGHSFGATAGYVFSARFPELSKSRIRLIVGLGPIVHPKEWKSGNKFILSNWNYISPVANFLSRGSVDIKSLGFFEWSTLCLPFPFQMKLCEIAAKLTYDFSLEKTRPEYWPLILLKSFDVVSIKSFNHLSQIITNGEFRNYDYGNEENEKGSRPPVVVDLSNVKIPTYILRAESDAMSTKTNVEFVVDSLHPTPKEKPVYVIKENNFTHGDFLWHKNVSELVNVPIITYLDNFVKHVKRKTK